MSLTSGAGRLLLAQVGAEARTRLRSPGTLVAVLAVVACSYLWMPAPGPYAASLTWGGGGGKVVTGIYNSAYVGTASALLVSTMLPFVGFYLVAGGVSRDRRSGVGAILAATPLSSAVYLGGKVVAHFITLLAVASPALVSAVLILLRYGEGRLEPLPLLVPWLLVVPPSLLMTAALAVLFDVTPGLRSRGGLVLWFFVWAFGLMVLPLLHVERGVAGLPVYDPTGFAWFATVLRDNTGLPIHSLSILSVTKEPMERVAWGGLVLTPWAAVARLANALWALVPSGAALLFFDRFDPARRGGRGRARGARRAAAGAGEGAAEAAGEPLPHAAPAAPAPAALTPVSPTFAPLAPYVAEARLVWDGAGPLRWLLPPAALLAVGPARAGRAGAASVLILLAVAVSEAAARERLAGAEPLVFALPAVPRSVALWKAGALFLFVGVLGLPMALRAALGSPAAGLAALLGLGFVALWAVAAGLLTGGGKLFTGSLLVLWYGALNGMASVDFCGTLSGHPSLVRSALFLAGGAAALAAAAAWHGRRRRGEA